LTFIAALLALRAEGWHRVLAKSTGAAILRDRTKLRLSRHYRSAIETTFALESDG